jgi:hypothetical protein
MPYGLFFHACTVYTMDSGEEAVIVAGGKVVHNQQSSSPEYNQNTYRLRIKDRKGSIYCIYVTHFSSFGSQHSPNYVPDHVLVHTSYQSWALPILLAIFRYSILIGYRKKYPNIGLQKYRKIEYRATKFKLLVVRYYRIQKKILKQKNKKNAQLMKNQHFKNFISKFFDLFFKYKIPLPSSAAVERLFSMGSAILIPKRSLLTATNFENLVFIKGNLHMIKKNWLPKKKMDSKEDEQEEEEIV